MDNTASNLSKPQKETNINHSATSEQHLNLKRHSAPQAQENFLYNNLNVPQEKRTQLCNELQSNDTPQLQQPHQPKPPVINENQSNFYESKAKQYYLEFMWKVDLTSETMLNQYIDVRTKTSRDGFKFLIGFVYFYHRASGNSIVIFAEKLEHAEVNEREFYNELIKVKNDVEHELKKENFDKVNNAQGNISKSVISNNPLLERIDCEAGINDTNRHDASNNSQEGHESQQEEEQKEDKDEQAHELQESRAGTNSSEDEDYEEEEEEEDDEEEEDYSVKVQHSDNAQRSFTSLEGNTASSKFPEKVNEVLYKKIIPSNPDKFHNQYQQISSNENDPHSEDTIVHPYFYISMKFLSPNKNLISTEISNITRPSKIILTSFVIENTTNNNPPYLTILMHQKMHKLKELSNDHIGLINEGMTCYMNSMIQSLNVLGYFKRGIFSMPYDNTERSLSYSLQRLFFDLTFEKEAASTNKLVQSFGWSADDIFIQHDVQEFNMMLSDLMEKKLKGTNNEEVFKYLFEGKICSKIECVDYQYESVKEEKFDDLQLNVKGCKDIYDSFDKYTEKEVLDGDDKYEVEGHGKEKAIKSTTFSKFPPVLILQLKRFEYNPKLGSMEKVNDHFEFYDAIDLSKYLNNRNTNCEDMNTKYKLLSVVVHKGNIYGGHYYAYTRFDVTKNEWYCFNDKMVHKADLYEVFDINFGGDYSAVIYKHETNSVSKISLKSDLSAYILIYVESAKAQEILKPIRIEEVPSELISQIKRDKLEEKLQMTLQLRDVNMINVYYLNEFMLKQYHGLGIGKGIPKNNMMSQMDSNKKVYKEESLLTSYLVIPRTTNVPELYSIFSFVTGIHFKEMSLFLVIFNNSSKPHNTYFTMHFLDYHTQMPIENIVRGLSERNKRPRRLVIFFDHSSIKAHEPIIRQYPPYDPSSFTISEHNLLDEKKIVISDNTSIYIPNSNPFIINQFHPRCLKCDKYTRKLLIYKALNIANSFNTLRTLNICVDERGGIEHSSIKLMREIEREILNYYIKEYNISIETMSLSYSSRH